MEGLVTTILEGWLQNLIYAFVDVSCEKGNINLLLDVLILKKCIFENNQILLICSAGLCDRTLVQGSREPLDLISKCKVLFTSGE